MKNLLKDSLKKGKIAVGITVTIGHPDVSEILAKMGFDFINFDTQHTPLSIETVQCLMQSISYSDATPIVRVPWNDIVMINRALDIGAHGIIVPFVNTREDMKRALNYAKFPPHGVRSYGPRRASLRDPEYVKNCDEEILVFPQIETKESLENIENILSVEGVEAFFVGPYDLSFSLGVFRQWDNPKFIKALEQIVEVAESTGTVPGMLALIEDPIKTIERGYRLINLGIDTGLLIDSSSMLLEKVNRVRK
ncbi:MAG: aldolase/citrate lyase family protein [Nitrososphaeria archaeon]|nr:aldolase/citrate lyase family protein [Nitrososphaeria archaeon]